MEAIVKNMPWVDITMGMELGKQTVYKNKFRAKLTLLNPSNPEALFTFADDMTTKLINTPVAGGWPYTNAFSTSMDNLPTLWGGWTHRNWTSWKKAMTKVLRTTS